MTDKNYEVTYLCGCVHELGNKDGMHQHSKDVKVCPEHKAGGK